eukprot:4425272-Prymnesium_polylepis.2
MKQAGPRTSTCNTAEGVCGRGAAAKHATVVKEAAGRGAECSWAPKSGRKRALQLRLRALIIAAAAVADEEERAFLCERRRRKQLTGQGDLT